MNIGERIIQKLDNDSNEYDKELKDLHELLYEVQQDITPIDFEVNIKHNYIDQCKEFLKLVDDKLYEVQEKIFIPEGVNLRIEINSTFLDDWSFLTFHNSKKEITMHDVGISKDNTIECPFIDLLYDEFLIELFNILKINCWFFLISCHQYQEIEWLRKEVGELKIISTNSDT